MTIDVETGLRAIGVRLRAEQATPPPVERVHAGARARRRRRNVRAAAVAIAAVLVVGAGAVTLTRGSGDRTDVAAGPASDGLPAFRMLPTDTAGARLTFAVYGPDPDSEEVWAVPRELRGVHVQRWERDGSTVLAVQSTGHLAIGHDGTTTSEPVEVPGWGPSTLLLRPDGVRSLFLWDGRQLHEVITRELSRDELVELGSRLRSQPSGLGAVVPVDAVPAGYLKVDDAVDPPREWVHLMYDGAATAGRAMSVTLRSSSRAQNEVDRFRVPAPRTATVLGRLADVWELDDEGIARVRFMPSPGVQAVVEVHGARGTTVDLALRVAASFRDVDEQTWAAALATTNELPDGVTETWAVGTVAPR